MALPSGTSQGQAEFEAAFRRYLAKLGTRYAPALFAALCILLLLLLVPSAQRTTGNGLSTLGAGTAPGETAAAGGGLSASSGTGVGTAVPGVGAGNPAAAAAGGATGAAAAGTTATPTGGVARTGVACTAGARQFAWSGHSPNCTPAFRGNNGGATAQGATASTITLTFRIPSSTQDNAISAAAGNANVNYQAMLADFQTYIDFFNRQFELYGRKVVLKPYHGQGDYIQEDQGQNLAGAQADAVTAKDMGAFGDVTFSLGSSEPYEEDLAQEHVMSFSGIAQPQSWFQQYAPYEWSVQGPTGSVGIQEAAALVCRRMAGMPAVYAGDAAFHATTRRFGIIYPEIPNYTAEANQYRQLLQQECGQGIAQFDGYTVDVSQFPSQAAAIIAQMNASHVSTILCACDPIFPIFLTRSAAGQSYHPEWVSTGAGDPAGRLYDQSEWAHEFGGGAQSPDPKTTEAYKVYQMANPGHQPAEGSPNGGPSYFGVPYYTLLHVFEGLQAAGPDLTPVTFQKGMFSLPPTAGVDPEGGQWVFGPNVYDPVVSFSLAWWNPNGTSAFDGQKGLYAACNGGQIYSVQHLEALGGPRQQLSCFGH